MGTVINSSQEATQKFTAHAKHCFHVRSCVVAVGDGGPWGGGHLLRPESSLPATHINMCIYIYNTSEIT